MTTLDDDLIALRREIHRHPELAGDERGTAGLVAEQLRAAGLDVTTGVGGHGVVAVLDGSAADPTVAYRADLDAVDARTNVLPIPRSGRVFDEGFASRVPGVAHLCGHDLHTAIGVGIARPYNREDFALFLREAPGAMVYLGVADAESGINGAPHAPDFAVDERVIGHGVRAMTGLLSHRLAALTSPGAKLGCSSGS